MVPRTLTLRSALFAAVFGLVMIAALRPEAPVADAAERGDVQAVVRLIEEGGDIDATQGDGMSALHWAAYNADAELAALLLEHGAEVEGRTRLGNYAPLHLAARSGRSEVVGLLLAAGADPGATTTSRGAQALHFAAETDNVEAIEALLGAGVDVDVREGAWEQTPLMFAASYGRTAAVQALLDAGADPGATSRVEDIIERAMRDRMAEQRRTARMRGEPDPFPDGLPNIADQVREVSESANRQIEDPEPLSYADLVAELTAYRDGVSRPNGIGMVGAMLQAATDPELVALYRERIVAPRRTRVRVVLAASWRLVHTDLCLRTIPRGLGTRR
jgi:hypothetical protein